VVECWSDGILEIGVMEWWSGGMLEIGVMEYWSSGKIRELIGLIIRIFKYAEK